jgi:DNA gyrase subunit A
MATREEDVVQHLFVASTHHTFLFFTNQGKVYWSKVYELPMAGRTSLGKAIVNLLDFDREETLTTVLNVPSFETGRTIIMATANGLIKKTDLMAYSRPMSRGIIALDLVPGDELISAGITDGSMDILLSTADGKSIRFHETDIRQTGRVARGVRGMRLVDDDRIVSMSMVSDVGETLLTATENGFGKRTALKEYHPQRRGGKGVITIKKSERNGQVVASLLVNDHDDVMLVTSKGKLIRIAVDGIPLISRNTQGVKLIGMDVEESVVGVVRLAEHATELEDVSDDDPSDALNMDVDDTAGPDES